MAVTITTKFYDTDTPAWQDLSKVVFTSPNLVSPNTAGTRSHILPGQGDLGLWYEDASQMHRIATSQTITSTDYYNYIVSTLTDIDMDLPSVSVTVTGTTDNYEVFFEHIKDSVGCTAIGYDDLTMYSVVQDIRVKLEYSTGATNWEDKGFLNNIISVVVETPGDINKTIYGLTTDFDTGDTYNRAWVVDVITSIPECYIDIDLDKPYKVTKIFMSGHYAYDSSGSTYFQKRFFGNYKILGKLFLSDEWAELYDGSNTTNLNTTVFLSSNDSFFKYYRILIENNTGLSGFNTGYYALSALQFYIFDYNNTPTRSKPLYYFKENGDADIVYINDISYAEANSYELSIDTVTGSGTLASGTQLKGWGTLSSRVDFQTNDSIVFELTEGEAYDCRLTAWDDVTHSSTDNELIQGDHVRVSALAFCATNSKLAPQESYSPINYVYGPVHNRILKGNTVYMGQNLFYGDFDMVYRQDSSIYGDYLIFKPMLYGVDSSLSYGVHDFVIVLSYSYT